MFQKFKCRFLEDDGDESQYEEFETYSASVAAEEFAEYAYDNMDGWELCSRNDGSQIEWDGQQSIVVTDESGNESVFTIIVEFSPDFTAVETTKKEQE